MHGGQRLHLKFHTANLRGSYLVFSVRDSNQNLIQNPQLRVLSDNSDFDYELYNNMGPAQWVIIGLASTAGLSPIKFGFYSPDGPSPAPGEVLTPPNVNPYSAASPTITPPRRNLPQSDTTIFL